METGTIATQKESKNTSDTMLFVVAKWLSFA
jgi:hypothetical protein